MSRDACKTDRAFVDTRGKEVGSYLLSSPLCVDMETFVDKLDIFCGHKESRTDRLGPMDEATLLERLCRIEAELKFGLYAYSHDPSDAFTQMDIACDLVRMTIDEMLEIDPE